MFLVDIGNVTNEVIDLLVPNDKVTSIITKEVISHDHLSLVWRVDYIIHKNVTLTYMTDVESTINGNVKLNNIKSSIQQLQII